MKQITLNIPDNKYSFFMELVKNLGLEKVKDKSSDSRGEVKKRKTTEKSIVSLRGKLQLSSKQYNDFHQHITDSRSEWDRSI